MVKYRNNFFLRNRKLHWTQRELCYDFKIYFNIYITLALSSVPSCVWFILVYRECLWFPNNMFPDYQTTTNKIITCIFVYKPTIICVILYMSAMCLYFCTLHLWFYTYVNLFMSSLLIDKSYLCVFQVLCCICMEHVLGLISVS